MIVLACVVLCGVVGFTATAYVVRQNQLATRTAPTPTGDRDRDQLNELGSFGQASGDLAARQRKAMIGAGVGIGCGLILGIGVAARTGRAKGASTAA